MEPPVIIYVPSEYLEAFKELISVGLEKAKISQEERLNLSAWWGAEQEFLNTEERQT